MQPRRPVMWRPPCGSAALSAAVAAGGGAGSAPRGFANSGPSTRPGNEASSLLAEMKMKQEKRDLRVKLKRELEELERTSTGAASLDFVKTAAVRTQLASVEAFLARTDGIQSLTPLPTGPAEWAQDAESTNLYVGSLSQEWTEELLMREFGKFGDVTSIKIMYPRNDAQRARGMNCGFVQFRNRKHAENAKNRLNGKDYFGMCIRIDWGKAVTPPSAFGSTPSVRPHVAALPAPQQHQLQPHIESTPGGLGGSLPGALALMPHQPQQLQPAGGDSDRKSRWNKAKTIAVQIPEDGKLRRLIDKTAEFVSLEGMEFETLLFSRERDNPRFSFLRDWEGQDYEDPLHVYYRWRVFSYSQGDSEEQWRTEAFQIYDNGPLWQPPACASRDRAMEETPSLLIPHFPGLLGSATPSTAPGTSASAIRRQRGSGGVGSAELTPEEQQQLEALIAGLSSSQASVAQAMVFCLDTAAASVQIAQRVVASLVEVQPGLTTTQLAARLCLLSDVLFNSHCTKPGASMYRRQFQESLPDVFARLAEVCEGLPVLAASAMRERASRCLRAWSEWSTFPPQFTKGLEATLFGRGTSSSSTSRPGDDAADAGTAGASSASSGGGASGGPGEAEARSAILTQKLQQWRTLRETSSLERACRLRGLPSGGTKEALVERLCSFECYWQEKEPPQVLRPTEPEIFDPELDGEALDDEDERALAEMEQETQEAMSAPGFAAKLLLGGQQDSSLVASRRAAAGDTASVIEVSGGGGSASSTAPPPSSAGGSAVAGGASGAGGDGGLGEGLAASDADAAVAAAGGEAGSGGASKRRRAEEHEGSSSSSSARAAAAAAAFAGGPAAAGREDPQGRKRRGEREAGEAGSAGVSGAAPDGGGAGADTEAKRRRRPSGAPGPLESLSPSPGPASSSTSLPAATSRGGDAGAGCVGGSGAEGCGGGGGGGGASGAVEGSQGEAPKKAAPEKERRKKDKEKDKEKEKDKDRGKDKDKEKEKDKDKEVDKELAKEKKAKKEAKADKGAERREGGDANNEMSGKRPSEAKEPKASSKSKEKALVKEKDSHQDKGEAEKEKARGKAKEAKDKAKDAANDKARAKEKASEKGKEKDPGKERKSEKDKDRGKEKDKASQKPKVQDNERKQGRSRSRSRKKRSASSTSSGSNSSSSGGGGGGRKSVSSRNQSKRRR